MLPFVLLFVIVCYIFFAIHLGPTHFDLNQDSEGKASGILKLMNSVGANRILVFPTSFRTLEKPSRREE